MDLPSAAAAINLVSFRSFSSSTSCTMIPRNRHSFLYSSLLSTSCIPSKVCSWKNYMSTKGSTLYTCPCTGCHGSPLACVQVLPMDRSNCQKEKCISFLLSEIVRLTWYAMWRLWTVRSAAFKRNLMKLFLVFWSHSCSFESAITWKQCRQKEYWSNDWLLRHSNFASI